MGLSRDPHQACRGRPGGLAWLFWRHFSVRPRGCTCSSIENVVYKEKGHCRGRGSCTGHRHGPWVSLCISVHLPTVTRTEAPSPLHMGIASETPCPPASQTSDVKISGTEAWELVYLQILPQVIVCAAGMRSTALPLSVPRIRKWKLREVKSLAQSHKAEGDGARIPVCLT